MVVQNPERGFQKRETKESVKMKKDFSLWDKKRFERLEKERVEYLQRLKIEESIKIMESLLNSGLDKVIRRIKEEFEKNGI